MCGSFDVDSRNKEIRELLASLSPNTPKVSLGQLFPGDVALTLIADQSKIKPSAMIWGFPRWQDKGLIFNARSETALQKNFFSDAIKHNRVVIPATGFYEWRKREGQKAKDKFLFTSPRSPILYLAGFWKNFTEQEARQHFTILTTQANQSVMPYHQRMPILLRREDVPEWLSGANLNEVLHRVPFEVHAQLQN